MGDRLSTRSMWTRERDRSQKWKKENKKQIVKLCADLLQIAATDIEASARSC